LLIAFQAQLATAAELPSIQEPLRTSAVGNSDYGVVIGIESYPFLVGMDVAHAHRDAQAFQDLLIYTLGLAPERVELLQGGGRSQIERALETAGRMAGPADTVWVYFSGHGAASSVDDERLLLGDAVKQDPILFEEEGVRLDVVQELAGLGGARVILVVDACHTGVGRDGRALVPGAKYVPHSALAARDNVTIWTATSSNEVAGPLDAAQHSAFTYFAIGSLRGWADGELGGGRDGQVTASEANQYVARALRAVGVTSQTPSLVGRAADVLVVAEGLEPGPDLTSLRSLALPVAPGAVETGQGVGAAEIELGNDTDLVALSAEAARNALERGELERRQAELERREQDIQDALRAERSSRVQLARAEIASAAEADWAALADLRESAPSEAIPVVEALVDKYGGASVTVDGELHEADIPTVGEAREWLLKHGVGTIGGLVIDSHGYELVAIEPAVYWMGRPPDESGHDRRETLHKVHLTRRVAIGTTEVTQDLYEAVMGENPSASKAPRHPVENLEWLDAIRFCNALSLSEGLTPAYSISDSTVTWERDSDGYRLPTEAEWEYTARGGAWNLLFSGSDVPDEVGWYYGQLSRAEGHQEVGQKQSNGYGLYDMSGNVAEWVWDAHADYPPDAVTDPTGPTSGPVNVWEATRIHRGGSWSVSEMYADVASRSWRSPVHESGSIGWA